MKNPKRIAIGATVTTKEPEEAFYSKYAGNPECIFRPGDVGIVEYNDAALVFRRYRYDWAYIVDFERSGQQWRVALTHNQIKQIV